MLRLLPIVLIIGLVLGGLGYWRFIASKPLETPIATKTEDSTPTEVPNTLPTSSPQIKIQPSSTPTPKPNSTPDPKFDTLEAQVTELKARVSALEQATPAPQAATSTSSTIYIPLGSGGGPWADTDWHSLSEYEISLNPSNYPNYTGMVLEVTFRLSEAAGTGYVKLYNVTDSGATSSELTTTSSAYSLQTSSSFKLASGNKTYKLQVKSSQNKDLYIQSARMRVNF